MGIKFSARDTIRVYARDQIFSGNVKLSLKTDGGIEADVATLFSMLGNRFKKDNVLGFDNESKNFINLKFADTSKSFVLKFTAKDDDDDKKMIPFLIEILKANDPMDEPMYTYLINTDKALFECKAGSDGFVAACSKKGNCLRPDIQKAMGIDKDSPEINSLTDSQVNELLNMGRNLEAALDKQICDLNEKLEDLSGRIVQEVKNSSDYEEQANSLENQLKSIHDDIKEINLLTDSKETADQYFDKRISTINEEIKIPEKRRKMTYESCREQIEIMQKGILYNLNYLSEEDKDNKRTAFEEKNAEYDRLFEEYKKYLDALKQIEADKRTIKNKEEA